MDELEVQRALESCLETGETLLAFTTGEIKSGIPFTKFQSATPYHVGLIR